VGTKSRETIYGASVRAAAERAAEARREADRLGVEAWNKRMLGFQGPAQPSPTLGDALNAGYRYLEVRCLGCDTHQTVALDIVRRPKATPVHELERYMRCKECSQVRGYPYKRSHLVALRATTIPRAIRRQRGGRVTANHGAFFAAMAVGLCSLAKGQPWIPPLRVEADRRSVECETRSIGPLTWPCAMCSGSNSNQTRRMEYSWIRGGAWQGIGWVL
jgi:ferric-dicitrate binding protein FerR (iron transport regulator)